MYVLLDHAAVLAADIVRGASLFRSWGRRALSNQHLVVDPSAMHHLRASVTSGCSAAQTSCQRAVSLPAVRSRLTSGPSARAGYSESGYSEAFQQACLTEGLLPDIWALPRLEQHRVSVSSQHSSNSRKRKGAGEGGGGGGGSHRQLNRRVVIKQRNMGGTDSLCWGDCPRPRSQGGWSIGTASCLMRLLAVLTSRPQ